MARAIHRKREMAEFLLGIIAARDRHRRPLIAHVSAGDRRDHAVARGRRRRVDAQNLRMGVGTADKGDMEHARQFDIADIFARAGNQPRVFFAFDACAYHRA